MGREVPCRCCILRGAGGAGSHGRAPCYILRGALVETRDEYGQQNASGERSAGEYQQSECADAGCAFPHAINFFGGHIWVSGEVGRDIDFADVSSDIEEEWKPANPGTKLNLADGADLRGDSTEGLSESHEEGEDAAASAAFGLASEARVSLADGARCGHGEQEGATGEDAENFELRVSQPWDQGGQIDVAE